MNYENIILETLERVKKLEIEMENLKRNLIVENNPKEKEETEFNVYNIMAGKFGKDTTKYIFNGVKYGKSRLVHAVVKKYVEQNPTITSVELGMIFSYTLQGTRSLGVIINKNEAQKRHDWEKRYFYKEEDQIVLKDNVCLVCTQWRVGNIKNFIARARQLGFKIISNE